MCHHELAEPTLVLGVPSREPMAAFLGGNKGLPTERGEEKKGGHKSEVNISPEQMRFCICTAELVMLTVSQPLSLMPIQSLRPPRQLSLEADATPATLGPRAYLQPLDSTTKTGSPSDHPCLYIWFEIQKALSNRCWLGFEKWSGLL